MSRRPSAVDLFCPEAFLDASRELFEAVPFGIGQILLLLLGVNVEHVESVGRWHKEVDHSHAAAFSYSLPRPPGLPKAAGSGHNRVSLGSICYGGLHRTLFGW